MGSSKSALSLCAGVVLHLVKVVNLFRSYLTGKLPAVLQHVFRFGVNHFPDDPIGAVERYHQNVIARQASERILGSLHHVRSAKTKTCRGVAKGVHYTALLTSKLTLHLNELLGGNVWLWHLKHCSHQMIPHKASAIPTVRQQSTPVHTPYTNPSLKSSDQFKPALP